MRIHYSPVPDSKNKKSECGKIGMDIEQIMLDVQTEFESSGLTDGLCGDFTREVVKRAIGIERGSNALINQPASWILIANQLAAAGLVE